MGYFKDSIGPHLVDAICGLSLTNVNRAKTVSKARGRVLEIGMGGARNMQFYDYANIEKLWGLEPNHTMRRKAARRVRGLPFEFEFLDLPGEEIPLEDDSVDTVVSTCTLCAIPGVEEALTQIRRVLKPNGRFLFMEHGESPDADVRKWQDRLNPVFVWSSCHINRPIRKLISGGGFEICELDADYVPISRNWPSIFKIASFGYLGSARIR